MGAGFFFLWSHTTALRGYIEHSTRAGVLCVIDLTGVTFITEF